MKETIQTAYEHYRDASQRFEYFVIGVSVALIAYAGEKLAPERLGMSPYTLQVIALILLITSVVVSLKRMEKIISFHKMNIEVLHYEQHRGSLYRFLSKGESWVDPESGEHWKADDIQKQIIEFDRLIPDLKKNRDDLNTSIAKFYSCRNFLLATGFALFFLAKIITPYSVSLVCRHYIA